MFCLGKPKTAKNTVVVSSDPRSEHGSFPSKPEPNEGGPSHVQGGALFLHQGSLKDTFCPFETWLTGGFWIEPFGACVGLREKRRVEG